MGKTKKSGVKGDGRSKGQALAEQIIDDKTARTSIRSKTRKRKEGDDEYVDEKLSRKILEQARLQQEELEDEHRVGKAEYKPKAFSLGARGKPADSDSEDDTDEEESAEFYENIEVDEDDEKALEMFMSANPPARRTLADIILEKITEKQTEIQSQMSDGTGLQMRDLDERVVNMYRSIRQVLAKYRSGKLPKAFKVIPNLRNWEQTGILIPDGNGMSFGTEWIKKILYITEPEAWSAAAMYQATRIFASNLNAKMAQRFYNLVLLPRIRDDIAEYKRLNFHLFMAMKKSLFKPAAFFKGILLPLCESGTCTLREAIIVGSVLAKNSIPMLHSAAAILKIAEMDYTGANSIFLRTLLDKKYALPYRVVDAVVFHFLKFLHDKRSLPVLWHQSLLTFLQRYKEDISSDQKEALMELLRAHTHAQITPEVRRELQNSKCRDKEFEGAGAPPSEEMQFG